MNKDVFESRYIRCHATPGSPAAVLHSDKHLFYFSHYDMIRINVCAFDRCKELILLC